VRGVRKNVSAKNRNTKPVKVIGGKNVKTDMIPKQIPKTIS
jgi:hypothetical protein